jgi:hypothetical protein
MTLGRPTGATQGGMIVVPGVGMLERGAPGTEGAAPGLRGDPVVADPSISVPGPVRSVFSDASSGSPAVPATPKLVVSLEQCFDRVKAGKVDIPTTLEFQARRDHDKSIKSLFDALPRVEKELELAVYIWTKAHSSEAVSTREFAAALIYISRFRNRMFFSLLAIPRLEVLADSGCEALQQFCSIMNACPDLDIDAVYRSIGRQNKVYPVREAVPLEQLIDEFNSLKLMGSFEAFLLDIVRPGTQRVETVGLIRQERKRQLRAEGCIDALTFRKLQARLHFEDRVEVLGILSQSSAYSSFLSSFVSTYVAGYEMSTAELASSLGAMFVRGRRAK